MQELALLTPNRAKEENYPGRHRPRCLHSPKSISRSRDLVPWVDLVGRLFNRQSVVVLPSHADASLFDHSFQSPTYKDAVFDEIAKYRKKYRF